MELKKPSIMVYIHGMLPVTSELNSILLGIEEEGLPFEVRKSDFNSAVSLAYNAALDSRVDVGIGIDQNENVVLHYTKLKKDSPLFTCCLKSGEKRLRSIGANAARLVKGIPFKLE
ncbi:MAG: glycerol dehydratase reactivase beta/small subunit family protein [Clostridiaceae bacterium]